MPKVIGQLKQESNLTIVKAVWQCVLNLMGDSEDPCVLTGKVCNEDAMLATYLESNDKSGTGIYYALKLILCCYFQDHISGLQQISQGKEYLDGLVGTYIVPLFHFHESLIRLANCSDASHSEQKKHLRIVSKNQKKMKKWAYHAPMNHLHKWQLVEAEKARVLGKDAQAMGLYDQAIAGAKENQYLHEEALAYELAAGFYSDCGKTLIARTYMFEARLSICTMGRQSKSETLGCNLCAIVKGTAS